MKKMQLLLMAAVLVAAASAFTTAPKKNLDPLYKAVYSGSNFDWVEITEEGTCLTNEAHYCEARFATPPSSNQIPAPSELVGLGDFQ